MADAAAVAELPQLPIEDDDDADDLRFSKDFRAEDATTLTSVPRHARPLAPLPPRPRHPSPDPTPSRRVLLQAARAGTAWRHHRRRELHALGERERADTVLLAGTAARRVKSLRRNATLFMCVLTPGRTLCRVRHV